MAETLAGRSVLRRLVGLVTQGVSMLEGQRRYLVVIGLLGVSAMLSWNLAGSRPGGQGTRLDKFPMVIGSWQGRDVGLSNMDVVYAVLETSAVLQRVYENSNAKGEVVDLLVTYFQKGHRGFHPPEVSFVASGNVITKSGIVRLPLAGGEGAPQLEANMFLGKTPSGEQLFLYWFGIGDHWMAGYYRGTAYLLWNTLLQRPSSASMVRLALPVVNGDLKRTMATATEFIRQIVPVLPEYLTEEPRA